MPDNELVFDFLDSLGERRIGLSDYPALKELIDYLIKINARRYTPAELQAFKKGVLSMAQALRQHADLETRVSESIF